jgi:SAM-dependent methyltransferase
MEGGKESWNSYWNEYRLDVVRTAAHVSACRVAESLVRRWYGQRVPAELRILDLGCGDGHLTHLVNQRLASLAPSVKIVGFDVSGTALSKTRGASWSQRTSFTQGDACKLPFRDGTFDGVVSFGYASVASYGKPEIQEELFRVTKPSGWLIADFRNHLSLYFVLFKPAWIVRWVKRFLGFGKAQYHLSTLGVERYFAGHGFQRRLRRFALSFPPVPFLTSGTMLRIERLLDVPVLGRLFGRVFFLAFRRNDA